MECYRNWLERAVRRRGACFCALFGLAGGSGAVGPRRARIYEAGNFELTTYADHGEQLVTALALAGWVAAGGFTGLRRVCGPREAFHPRSVASTFPLFVPRSCEPVGEAVETQDGQV